MPVKIRLSRVGKKHAPFYRVVSVDGRKKRDGAFLDDLGTYDALKSTLVRFDQEGYERRIAQGAVPTDSVKKIYNQFKADAAKPTVKVVKKAAPKKAVKKEAAVKEETPEIKE
ncbi:MAG: 30S ribosomal protein S16 [Candidatus Dependentiae bacterium]